MNKVILMGRLARDPEVRYTGTGKAVATFSLAVNRRFGRSNSNDQQPTADFIPIVVWDKLAEVCGNNLKKGSQIALEGRMQVRTYDDQNGNKRYVTEVVCNELEFCGSKAQGEGGFTPAPSTGATTTPSMGTTGGFGTQSVDDDIPF